MREVILHSAPDVLVVAGIDWDLEGHTVTAFADFIGDYPHRFTARPNRGIDSGFDLDGDGRLGEAEDAHGFAEFPGQDGMAVLSRVPIGEVREFTELRWADLPGALLEKDPPSRRLSTTVHWDVQVRPDGAAPVSLLVWHATPPVFDGPEDRNGRRNHDEAALWLAYLDGVFGVPPERFVLAGMTNLDPVDGDGRPGALNRLLSDARVQDAAPRSEGGMAAADAAHLGDPGLDTVDWPDGPGSLRVDYVLPSSSLEVVGSGVLWPVDGSLRGDVERASRHRLVWVDLHLLEEEGF